MKVHAVDCVLGTQLYLADDSVDAIVTDPPYELGFMGKAWDSTGIANDVAMWRQAFRVLKPGGHLLAFGGTRTYHRMVCAIEDAGFDVRDQIGWLYGSGFPKSLDVAKAIDKGAGIAREDKFEGSFGRRAGPTGNKKCDACGKWLVSGSPCKCPRPQDEPQTDAARQWQGWGTALKPAWEPIVMARKPLIGTVAANVLAHGTGALNIDGCRVGDEARVNGGMSSLGVMHDDNWKPREVASSVVGRWPANIIHDGSDEVIAAFPQAPGQLADARNDGAEQGNNVYAPMKYQRAAAARVETDKSAPRFFYCAKASKRDRGQDNTHPTVKPTDLMRYLCRLVTPAGGLVLDPFSGSGSTGRAAKLEGFRFVGFEKSEAYAAIANARIAAA